MTTVRLQNGPLRCDIRPDLGGCIAGLWLGDLPVLRSTAGDDLHSVRQSGAYPLVPFSNRVGEATLVWQGTGHPLVRDAVAQPHAIHGVGWMRPWEVLEQDDTFVMLAHEHRAETQWPFAYDASQTLRLHADALELTLGITNQSRQPAPVGLGWHPYFVKRARSHIAFKAQGRWEMGTDQLPTERRQHTGLDVDCIGLEVDHCFDGWDGHVCLQDEHLQITLESNLRHLVVFTNGTRDFVAVEPVSHVNNAVNLQALGRDPNLLGIRVLAPGESLAAHMRLTVGPAPDLQR